MRWRRSAGPGRGASRVPLAGGVVVEPLDLARDVLALALEVVGHRVSQAAMLDPVHAPRLGGVECPQVLELPPGAGLEAMQPLDDAMLDGGGVADVEVQ